MTPTPTPAPRLPSPDDPVPVRAAPPTAIPEPPLYQRAPLTFAIIVANVAVFAGQTLAAGLGGLATMPGSVVLAFGANNVSATLYEGRYETLLTSCFVHASLLHIALNMAVLRQIGPLVERAVGAARMAPLYVLSGIAGSMGSTFWGWHDGTQRVSVGASGAICGLAGAALVIGYRVEGPRSPLMLAMGRWLLMLFALGLFVSFVIVRLAGGSGGFDNAAHIAGAIGGASVAFAWRRGEAYDRSATTWIVVLCTCIVVGAGLRTAIATLTRPLATMTFDQRVAQATRAIDDGRCPEAREVLLSLQRTAPRAPEVMLVTQNYRHMCRR
jgi:rhomboid protease GluP